MSATDEPEIVTEEIEGEEALVDPRPFVLEGLGLAESFLDLERAARARELADVEGQQLRRHLGRALFYALLVVAFILVLRGMLLYSSCGLIAILAGRDLGRFAHQRRLLGAARALFLATDDQA